MNNQDKEFWCSAGAAQEERFASPVRGGCVLLMNPAKAENKYTHDLYMMMPADLKTVRTKFRTADKYGVDPDTAVTLNKKDVDRYSEKYPNIVIIFDIDFGTYKSIRYASLRAIQKWVEIGRAKLHKYLQRDGDKVNATESYVLDSQWMAEL